MSLNSPFGKAFQTTLQRLKDEVPEILHIDQDMGQLEGNSTRAAVMFPCTLIDYQNFQYGNLSENVQIVEGDVIIKLGWAQFTPSSDKVDEGYREEALKVYELEWKINKALHGWSPGEDFGYYTRTGVVATNIAQGIRVRTLTYRLEFEDRSTQDVDTVAHPAYEGDVQIKSSLP